MFHTPSNSSGLFITALDSLLAHSENLLIRMGRRRPTLLLRASHESHLLKVSHGPRMEGQNLAKDRHPRFKGTHRGMPGSKSAQVLEDRSSDPADQFIGQGLSDQNSVGGGHGQSIPLLAVDVLRDRGRKEVGILLRQGLSVLLTDRKKTKVVGGPELGDGGGRRCIVDNGDIDPTVSQCLKRVQVGEIDWSEILKGHPHFLIDLVLSGNRSMSRRSHGHPMSSNLIHPFQRRSLRNDHLEIAQFKTRNQGSQVVIGLPVRRITPITIQSSRRNGKRDVDLLRAQKPDILNTTTSRFHVGSDTGNMLIVKHADRLNKGIEALEQVRTEEVPYLWARDPHELRMVHEAESLLLTSILMLRSSLVREERRSELREDFPEQDNLNWLKWIRVKTKDDEFLFDTLDIPIDSYPVRSKREKFLHPAWKAANRTVKSPVS